MSSHYVLKGQIIHLENKLSDMREHQASILKGLTIFRWVTLLLYLAFTLSLYVGDVMNIKTLFNSFVGSFIGFALYLMIAIGLAYSLASFKHNFYVYRGIHGGAMPMVFVVILMGLTAEIFQSSGQQDVKARAGAAASQQYQTMLQQSPAASLSQGYADPYADKLIKLEGELAKTQELERTCVKTCSAQRQKIEALQGQIAAVQQLQQQSASKHSTDLTTAQNLYSQQLNAVEEKHYNPTIRSVKEMTGVGIGTAISIIMGIISIIFEICHGYFSAMYNRTLRSIEALNQQLVALRGQYADLTGTELDNLTATPNQPTPTTRPTQGQVNMPTANLTGLSGALSSFVPNLTGQHSPTLSAPPEGVLEKFATEMNKAQQARDALHANMAKAAEKVGQAIDDATSYPKPTSTYAKELASAGIPSPHDPVLDQAADQESIRRIIKRGNPNLTPPLPAQNLTDNLTGQVNKVHPEAGQVIDQAAGQPDKNAENLAKAHAEIEAMKAEKAKLEAESTKLKAEFNARLEEQARAAKAAQQRAEAEAQAREQAEKERAAQAARAKAEQAAREAAQQRAAAEARLKAAQAAREAAERQAQLERERAEAAAKAQAEREAERGNLTEAQINQAAEVIKQVIGSGQVNRLGFNSLKEHLIAAKLPSTSDSLRRLIKLGCQQLITEGIVRNNPNAGTGKPDFLIV